MKKFEVLKAIVALQALCMIALAVFMIVKLLPGDPDTPGAGNAAGNGEGKTAVPADSPVATIAGRTITAGELQERLMEEYGPAVLRQMMVREALRAEAEAYGLDVSPRELEEELAMMMEGYGDEASFYEAMQVQLGMSPEAVRDDAVQRLLLEKIAVRPYPITDAEVDGYIAEQGLLEPRIRLTLSWILTSDADEAEALLQRIADGASFEEQARIYSIDEFTSEDGGRIGTVEADDPYLDSAVLETAAAMTVGETTGPIETAFGWAVVRLDGRETIQRTDIRSLRDQVRKLLGLAAAPPLHDVEASLLDKYGAVILDEMLMP